MIKWLAEIRFHWYCGNHSGFPNCCRLWFIFPWLWMADNHWNKPLWNLYRHFFGERGIGYVRCPICIVSNTQFKVNACDCKFLKEGRLLSDAEIVSRGW